MTRVKWASEPDVVELSYDETSARAIYWRNDATTTTTTTTPIRPAAPLKSSLKRSTPPPLIKSSSDESAPSPTPQPEELLEWAKQRHQIITAIQGEEEWRQRGSRLRARLVRKDEECGGNAFSLSNRCKIERYFDVAERVLEQFLSTSVNDKVELTESYLVGNRLVKFLAQVLPGHDKYFSEDPDIWELRTKSQKQLVQLLLYLERLALVIDEDEYNKYILSDLKEKESLKKTNNNSTTAETIDLQEFIQETKPRGKSSSRGGSRGSNGSSPRTAESKEVHSLFRDLGTQEKWPTHKDSPSGWSDFSLSPWNSPDKNGFPRKSLLDDVVDDSDGSDILDSSFTEQQQSDAMVFASSKDDAFLFQRKDSGSLVESASSSLHSSSWDDSFKHYAKHHEQPPMYIKKKGDKGAASPVPAPYERDVFDMMSEWGDDWTPSEGFEQRQNVFRQDQPARVSHLYSSPLNSYNKDSRGNSIEKKLPIQKQQQAPLRRESQQEASLESLRQHKSALWNESQRQSQTSRKGSYVHPRTLSRLKEIDQPKQLEERQQSPKSVTEFPQWVSWDETSSTHADSTTSMPNMMVSSYFPLLDELNSVKHEKPKYNDDDEESSGVYSDEETQSLTRGIVSRNNTNGPMRHFKGCVKCLME